MRSKVANLNILMSAFLIVLAIAMVFLATYGIVTYYVASIVICLALILPFLVLFERSRSKCKVLVLIATLSALAIVGRWAFAWAPNVTLSTGIIILAGVSMGGVPGFMVGAVTMLVSNMLLGQGIWTVWQMLAAGMAGLFAGLLRKADKVTIAIYGLFVGFAYGFIMDISTLLIMYNDALTWQRFLVVWGASFYFDLAHAISTVFTIIIFYNIIVPTIRRKLDLAI